jgi:hypothetical protein
LCHNTVGYASPEHPLGSAAGMASCVCTRPDGIIQPHTVSYTYDMQGSTDERRRATTGNADAHAYLDRGWRPHDRRRHVG